jgi:hypothetical protein
MLLRRIQTVKPNIKSSQVKLLKGKRPLYDRLGYILGSFMKLFLEFIIELVLFSLW